jgi:hypothetical protein
MIVEKIPLYLSLFVGPKGLFRKGDDHGILPPFQGGTKGEFLDWIPYRGRDEKMFN